MGCSAFGFRIEQNGRWEVETNPPGPPWIPIVSILFVSEPISEFRPDQKDHCVLSLSQGLSVRSLASQRSTGEDCLKVSGCLSLLSTPLWEPLPQPVRALCLQVAGEPSRLRPQHLDCFCLERGQDLGMLPACVLSYFPLVRRPLVPCWHRTRASSCRVYQASQSRCPALLSRSHCAT